MKSSGNPRRGFAVGAVFFPVALVAGFALLAGGCGGDPAAPSTPAPPEPPAPPPPAPPPPEPPPPEPPPPEPFSWSRAPVTHLAPLYPENADGSGREGFIRIVNYSDEPGAVQIVAFDEDGLDYGPARLDIEVGQTVHLAPEDLVRGNPDQGVSGATGSGWGDGRLELTTDLDLMVLSFIRHGDGLVMAMHDVTPREGNRYSLQTFRPGSDPNQASRLRLIHTGQEPTWVRIRGFDDRGVPSREATVSLPAGATREWTAAELESGSGMSGALGDGVGNWRLVLESEDPVVALNLLESSTGHLANLSGVPRPTKSGTWIVPLVPGGSDPWGRLGLVRIINHSARDGEIHITAFDDSGRRFPPFTARIGAGHAVHLDSGDLEAELSPGAGPGAGSRRLVVSSELDIEVLSYIEHRDGYLTPMHDVAPLEGHRISTFHPESGSDPGSWLRLVNAGEEEAHVSIIAMDERGSASENDFETTVPAGAAREFTASELGLGGGAADRFGDGPGNWRLVIHSEGTVEAMSLLEGPTGRLANLSTEPRRDPVLVEDHFAETSKGNPAGIAVSVVDGQGFDPGTHGQRITDTFLERTGHASLVQIGGWGRYALHGSNLGGTNMGGYILHALTRRGGIFWTATDSSPLYEPDRTWAWFVKHGRPFKRDVREFANWRRDRDALYVGSVENETCRPTTPGRCVALYCDDFELDDNGGWIPLCGEFADYVAHSGVGLDTVVFAGALSGGSYASGSIRADGVFAPHTIHVESPDGSTSHATAVLAAYATNLALANPSWSAARLKRELMALTREETVSTFAGIESNVVVRERRTVKTIRPGFAP